jgi:hypothetical protein
VLNARFPGQPYKDIEGGSYAKTRAIVSEMINSNPMASGKSVFCNKSVTTIDNISVVHAVFPEAKFLCLYRHCMDVVHSAIDSGKYGWASLGLTEYIRNNPANTVDALVDYWVDKASATMDIEALDPDRCLRIKYESLVSSPNSIIGKIFTFLGLDCDESQVERVFSTRHQIGPGDSKIWATNKIHRSSIGKGYLIGRHLISEEKRERMNSVLSELDYPLVGTDWGQGISPLVTEFGGEEN